MPGPAREHHEIAGAQPKRLAVTVDAEPAIASRHDVEAWIPMRLDTEPPRRTHVGPAVHRRTHADRVQEIADDVRSAEVADPVQGLLDYMLRTAGGFMTLGRHNGGAQAGIPERFSAHSILIDRLHQNKAIDDLEVGTLHRLRKFGNRAGLRSLPRFRLSKDGGIGKLRWRSRWQQQRGATHASRRYRGPIVPQRSGQRPYDIQNATAAGARRRCSRTGGRRRSAW